MYDYCFVISFRSTSLSVCLLGSGKMFSGFFMVVFCEIAAGCILSYVQCVCNKPPHKTKCLGIGNLEWAECRLENVSVPFSASQFSVCVVQSCNNVMFIKLKGMSTCHMSLYVKLNEFQIYFETAAAAAAQLQRESNKQQQNNTHWRDGITERANKPALSFPSLTSSFPS